MSDPIPGVLAAGDLANVRDAFGVEEAQVRRDHVISHALAALSQVDTDALIFFGGTALSRTHLPAHRLSEDIDLLAVGSRDAVAQEIEAALITGLRRAVGSPGFEPRIAATKSSDPSVMTVGRIRVQIQLLRAVEYPAWPTQVLSLEQRYADAPPARLRVLTRPAFAAAKLAAWHDRSAARDLFDLWAMAEQGMIDDDARQVFSRWGPLTDASRVSFSRVPSEAEWVASLAHQGRVRVDPIEAADVVRTAWAAKPS